MLEIQKTVRNEKAAFKGLTDLTPGISKTKQNKKRSLESTFLYAVDIH